MSTTPARRREPARPDTAPARPGTVESTSPSPSGRTPGGKLGRLAARIGAAVRGAHSASVPF